MPRIPFENRVKVINSGVGMTPSQRAIRFEGRVKLFFFLMTLVSLFAAITLVKNMSVSFLLAFVSYYLLAPAVDILERRGLSRALATLIPFVSLALVVTGSLYYFWPSLVEQLMDFKTHWPEYFNSAKSVFASLETKVAPLAENFNQNDLEQILSQYATDFSKALFHSAPEYVSQSLTVLILAPFLSFFMLLSGREFMRSLISMVPNNLFELTLNLNHQISTQLGGFIRARLIETVIVFLILWGGLDFLNFPYGIVLALVAAILNIIPYLGPVIGILPPALIALASTGQPLSLGGLVLLFFIVQVIDAALLVPFLVAKIVDLHPVLVVFAIIAGAQVLGIMGMIICIPVAATLRVTSVALYRHFTGFRT